MADFQRINRPFLFKGLNLATSVDTVPDGQYPVATNVRSYSEGVVRSRPGFSSIATAAGAGGSGIQAVRRLNDGISGNFTYIVMAGTKLFAGTSGALTQTATGFSGNPFTSAIAAPFQSPRPYIYIAETNLMGKLKVGDTSLTNWGIPAPTTAPVAALGAPLYTIISDCEVAADWTQSGTAAAPSLQLRVDTTISQIAYDSAAPANASVGLTSFVNVGRGIFLKLGGSEVVLTDDVIPGIKTTTVAQIIYDSGSTGTCSIQLATKGSKRHLRKGALVTIGGEACAVLDASIGPDGLPSIRVRTTSAHAAGDAVVGITCFRAYVSGTFAAAATVQTHMVESAITAGLGQLTAAAVVDASVAGTRPITDEDEMHISLKLNKLKRLTEMKIYLDVDETTNDFTRNYYWKTLSRNDFVDVTDDSITTLQGRINRLQNKLFAAIQRGDFAAAEAIRQRIANKEAHLEELSKTPLDDQSVLGDEQFTELRFKVKELTRVGADVGRSLRDVQAVRVQVNCTGSVTLDIDAWWIGGAYGPDVGDVGLSYHYMARFRSKATGARSNWSPMSRSGIEAHRQAVVLTPPTTADSQADTVDYARLGGALLAWKIIGNGPVGSSFTDMWDDLAVESMPDAENDEHQPFAVTDLPASGTCKVAGSTVTWLTGDRFNVNWEKFSFFNVNGVPCTLSGPPLSDTVLQLNENAGSSASAAFYAPSPLLAGQALPCVWGPFGYGEEGVYVFGVGNSKNAGTLYWTVGNNPDVQHSTGSLEVCSPSEKLQNGCIWQGRSFVLSSENLYQVLPSFDTPAMFVAEKVAGSKGLYAPYALCVAPEGIYHLTKDGIYLNGTQRITDDLYPIFPHDGQAAIAVNGYNPPDFSSTSNLRMEYDDGFIYFSFLDTGGTPRYKAFVLNTRTRAWSVDFPAAAALRVLCYYSEEGAGVHSLLAGGQTAGGAYTLYRVTGTSDDGTAISCELETPADNQGDGRLQKLYGDLWLDFNAAGANVSASVGFDQFTVAPTPNPQTLTNSSRGNRPIDINSGAGQLARNVGLDLTWASSSVVVYLFGWGATFVPKQDDVRGRYTDADDAGYFGAKFLQGFILEANTFGVTKSITVQADNGANGAWQDVATFNVNHAQQSEQGYSLPAAAFVSQLNIGHNFRAKINDTTIDWELFRIRWVYEPSPELVKEWKTQGTTLDQMGFAHLRDMYLSLQSSATVTLIVTVDGVDHTFTVPSTAGVHSKVYIVADVMKGKEWVFTLTSSAGFRVFQKDIEVRAKTWGSAGAYQVLQPFGDTSRERGAAI